MVNGAIKNDLLNVMIVSNAFQVAMTTWIAVYGYCEVQQKFKNDSLLLLIDPFLFLILIVIALHFKSSKRSATYEKWLYWGS